MMYSLLGSVSSFKNYQEGGGVGGLIPQKYMINDGMKCPEE